MLISYGNNNAVLKKIQIVSGISEKKLYLKRFFATFLHFQRGADSSRNATYIFHASSLI